MLGPRGATVVSLASFAGLCMAYVGWLQRDTGLIAPGASAPSAATAPASPSAATAPASPSAATAPASPSAAATPSASPAAGSGATGSASAGAVASSPASGVGPALSSEPYASYAYLVWPGPLGGGGKLAMTGFTVNVTRQAGGISLKVGQDGQAMTSVSHFYPGGAKVYVLDSNLGDDGGGNLDYFPTDDGLIVTNAQGQVLP